MTVPDPRTGPPALPADPSGAPSGAAVRPVSHRRRWAAVAVAVLGAVALWAGAGAPWWAPAVLVAGSLAGRLLGVLIPSRWRPWSVAAGAAAAGVWLVVQLSTAGVALAVALVLAVVVLAVPGGGRDRWRLVAAGAAVLLALAGGVGVAVERVQDARAQADIDRQAGDYARAQLLPPSPARVVRELYAAVADDDPAVCPAFAPGAAAEFAAATGAPGVTDCPGAVHVLHAAVTDPRRYQRPDRASIAEHVAPDGESGDSDGLSGALG